MINTTAPTAITTAAALTQQQHTNVVSLPPPPPIIAAPPAAPDPAPPAQPEAGPEPIYVHGDKMYKVEDVGPWRTFVEAGQVPRILSTDHRWYGPKIPLALASQIIAFFEWTQKTTKSEAVVHLFCNEDMGEWAALALPQRGRGLRVELVDDHPNRIPSFQKLPDAAPGSRWEERGSWHHHCTTSAFQSGTDSADEKTKEGIHLTTGNLESPKYTLHARTTLRGRMTPSVLSDWFELPECVKAAMEAGFIDADANAFFGAALCKPKGGAGGEGFPEWWKENVIQTPTHTTGYVGDWNTGGHMHHIGNGCYVSRPPAPPAEKPSPIEWAAPKTPGGGAEPGAEEQGFLEALETELENLLFRFNVTADELVRDIADIESRHPAMVELMDLCAQTGVEAEDVGAMLKRMSQAEARRTSSRQSEAYMRESEMGS